MLRLPLPLGEDRGEGKSFFPEKFQGSLRDLKESVFKTKPNREMFQLFVVIIVIAIVFFFVSRGRALFQLHIENGKITKTQGSISASVRDDFEMAVSDVKSGKIIGQKTQQSVKLSFRGDIGEMTQQQLRNIVGMHYR